MQLYKADSTYVYRWVLKGVSVDVDVVVLNQLRMFRVIGSIAYAPTFCLYG
jgi:hypothetical protein